MNPQLRLASVVALFAAATPCLAQYAGPAILSRGEAPTALTSVAVKFRPFVEIAGRYNTGLAGLQLNDEGQLAGRAAYGESISWGISGSHQWKLTSLGLTYRGSYTDYRGSSRFNSVDQSMMFSLSQKIARHMTLELNSSAGEYSRDFGLLGLPQTVPFDPATTNIPTTDFFDNRTYYSASQANLRIQKSARLSFLLGGGLFLARRRSAVLYGTTGTSAIGDVQYRVNRRTTIGASYNYSHVTAVHVFGTMDAHGVSAGFGRALTRRLEFSGFAGALRPETKFLRSTPVDPVIAAVLGVTSTVQITHSVEWTPVGSARLSWVYPRGVAFISAGRTVTPGNGLFLTTKMTIYSAGYVYTGLRRWSFNTQTSYREGTSIQNFQGAKYSDVSAGFTVSRSLFGAIHLVSSYAARRYASPTFGGYNRTIHEASIGLGYSPGDIPLRVW